MIKNCKKCEKDFDDNISNKFYEVLICPECMKIKELEENKIIEKEKQERIDRHKIEIFGGIKILDLTYDKFIVNQNNKEVFEISQNFDYTKDNIYIYGQCGCGKTHLAGAILNKFMDKQTNIAFHTLFSLSRSLRMKEPDEENQILQKYIQADIFILDDLGIGKTSEFGLQILYEIIDGRDKNNKTGLVITSNLSLADLSLKLQDDRLSSRLAGMCKILFLEGNDYRLKRGDIE